MCGFFYGCLYIRIGYQSMSVFRAPFCFDHWNLINPKIITTIFSLFLLIPLDWIRFTGLIFICIPKLVICWFCWLMLLPRRLPICFFLFLSVNHFNPHCYSMMTTLWHVQRAWRSRDSTRLSRVYVDRVFVVRFSWLYACELVCPCLLCRFVAVFHISSILFCLMRRCAE